MVGSCIPQQHPALEDLFTLDIAVLDLPNARRARYLNVLVGEGSRVRQGDMAASPCQVSIGIEAKANSVIAICH